MLNPTEEAKYAELKVMCRELKVPAPPEIIIGLKVHDKNGILFFDDIQRGHSWTRNFYNVMFCNSTKPTAAGASFAAGYLTDKLTGGTVEVVALNSATLTALIPGAAADSTYGILVGTSDTAFSAEQYNLVAPIAQGTGGGQFSYAAGTVDAGTYTATPGSESWKTTHVRIMNNNSGGSITVKEAGLVAVSPGGRYLLFERSVLAPTVPVPNAAQLTVTYEISMDFSAID